MFYCGYWTFLKHFLRFVKFHVLVKLLLNSLLQINKRYAFLLFLLIHFICKIYFVSCFVSVVRASLPICFILFFFFPISLYFPHSQYYSDSMFLCFSVFACPLFHIVTLCNMQFSPRTPTGQQQDQQRHRLHPCTGKQQTPPLPVWHHC